MAARRKSASKNKKEETAVKPPVEEVVEPAVEVKPEVVASKKKAAAKTAQKFAETKDVVVEPMSAEEMKQLIAQSKEGPGEDCLMCGS